MIGYSLKKLVRNIEAECCTRVIVTKESFFRFTSNSDNKPNRFFSSESFQSVELSEERQSSFRFVLMTLIAEVGSSSA